jgi:protease-4
VACPADVIVALPATLTGSIGVFGGKVVVQGLLERLGVTTGTVSRGEHALMFSARRGFDDAERERLAASLDAIYDDFVGKVAKGRGIPVPEVEAVARGRVWTGSDAVGAGLVDRLGGLRDALQIARSRAGLPDDAPIRPALRISPLARLRRPTSSQDPRAGAVSRVPGFADVAAELGPSLAAALRMPSIRLR